MRELQRVLAGVIALGLVVTACTGSVADETSTSEGEATTTTRPTTTTTTVATTTSTTEAATTTVAVDTEASITIVNFNFRGATSVEVGTTVTVTNEDGVSHTWTSDDELWDSGTLATGESFELTFDEPGEYSYFCSIHPQMTGTITVEG